MLQRLLSVLCVCVKQLYNTVLFSNAQGADVGTFVYDVNATDADYQLNGIVEYFFENRTTTNGPFHIDRGTGRITLQEELDREEQERYEV